MENQNRTSNFWFGFALGMTASTAALYFFGTKKGRLNLRRFLDLTENLEASIDDVINSLGGDNAAEFKRIVLDKIRSKSGQASSKPACKGGRRFELRSGKIVE